MQRAPVPHTLRAWLCKKCGIPHGHWLKNKYGVSEPGSSQTSCLRFTNHDQLHAALGVEQHVQMQAGSAEVAFRLPLYDKTRNEELGTWTALMPLLVVLEANQRCTRSLGQVSKGGWETWRAARGRLAEPGRQASCWEVAPLTVEAPPRTPVLSSHQLGSYIDSRNVAGQSVSSQLPHGTIRATEMAKSKLELCVSCHKAPCGFLPSLEM